MGITKLTKGKPKRVYWKTNDGRIEKYDIKEIGYRKDEIIWLTITDGSIIIYWNEDDLERFKDCISFNKKG